MAKPEIRDVLFGDLSFAQWPSESSTQTAEPWLSFVRARDQLSAGDLVASRQTLQSILEMAGLESRHYLQAWHFLRGMGEQPPAGEAKRVYGVVLEVTMDGGLDIVAAYADHTARYINHTGAAVIWEGPDDSLNRNIDELLEAGRLAAEQIGPWEQARPSAPPMGQVRINLLLPSGLHFGEGAYEALASDPLGGPVIAAALQLMQELIARSEQGRA